MNAPLTPEQLAAHQQSIQEASKPSALTPEQLAYYQQRASQEGFTHQELVALDQFMNSALFFWMVDHAPDQTMSEHFFAAAQKGDVLAKAANWMLGKIQADHGALATAGDMQRAEEQEAEAAKALDIPPEPPNT